MLQRLIQWLKSLLPEQGSLRNQKSLQILSGLLNDPYLWRLNRHSVSMALAVGFFIMMIPLPFQMLLAAAFAILTRANLAISIAMVWISNPITTPFIIFFSYKVGIMLLDMQGIMFNHLEFSWDWLTTQLPNIGKPLLLGTLVIATVGGIILYCLVNLLWRVFVIWYKKNRPRKFN